MEEIMKEGLLADALLCSYKDLVHLAEAIDCKVINLARNRDYLNSSTIEVSEKIISLIEKKILICNTKVLVDNVLKALDRNEARLLILKYIDNLSNEKLAYIFKINVRTVYRKLEKAKESFYEMLIKKKFNEETLKAIYKNQYWFMRYTCQKEDKALKSMVG